jgi:hypothetical protein
MLRVGNRHGREEDHPVNLARSRLHDGRRRGAASHAGAEHRHSGYAVRVEVANCSEHVLE